MWCINCKFYKEQVANCKLAHFKVHDMQIPPQPLCRIHLSNWQLANALCNFFESIHRPNITMNISNGVASSLKCIPHDMIAPHGQQIRFERQPCKAVSALRKVKSQINVSTWSLHWLRERVDSWIKTPSKKTREKNFLSKFNAMLIL